MTYKHRIKRLEKTERARKVFPLVISGASEDGFLIGGGTVGGRRFSCQDVLDWPAPVFIIDPQAVKFYCETVENSPRKHYTEIWETADGGVQVFECPVA